MKHLNAALLDLTFGQAILHSYCLHVRALKQQGANIAWRFCQEPLATAYSVRCVAQSRSRCCVRRRSKRLSIMFVGFTVRLRGGERGETCSSESSASAF